MGFKQEVFFVKQGEIGLKMMFLLDAERVGATCG